MREDGCFSEQAKTTVEVEAASVDFTMREGDSFREDKITTLSEPSKSARSNMTEGELKWYSSLWPFDLNSRILHMGLTAGEMKWLSRCWNFDLKEENEGLVVQVPGRERQPILTFCRDKTVSGEYILESPPKKPGGLKIFYVLLIVVGILMEGGECHAMEEGSSYGSLDETQFLFLIAAVLLFLLTLRGKDNRESELQKMRKMRQRRIAKKKKAKRQKGMGERPSSAASTSSKDGEATGSSMDANNVKSFRDTEMDKLSDKLMEDALDQDIQRYKSSDGRLEKHDGANVERERTENGMPSDLDECSASAKPEVSENDILPSPRRREQNLFSDLFNSELESLSAISPAVTSRHNVDVNTLLWKNLVRRSCA